MADVTHTDVTLHGVVDDEGGSFHVVADVDGVLIPLQSVPLGLFETMKTAAENDTHAGIYSAVEAPSKADSGSKKTATK